MRWKKFNQSLSPVKGITMFATFIIIIFAGLISAEDCNKTLENGSTIGPMELSEIVDTIIPKETSISPDEEKKSLDFSDMVENFEDQDLTQPRNLESGDVPGSNIEPEPQDIDENSHQEDIESSDKLLKSISRGIVEEKIGKYVSYGEFIRYQWA